MSANERRMCPRCGYEYESWVEICPDCGVLIETVSDEPSRAARVNASLDEFGPDEDPHWKVIINVPNAIIGTLIKSQLEDAGIPVLMRRAKSADIAQFSGNDFVPHDLLVPESKTDEAQRLLDSSPDRGANGPYWADDFDMESDDDWDEGTPSAELDRDPELDQLRKLWHAGSDAEQSDVAFQDRQLPEGWTLLPTERDVRARAQHQRAHGDSGQWEWQRAATGLDPVVSDKVPIQDAYTPEPGIGRTKAEYGYSRPTPRAVREQYEDYEDGGWSGSPRWIRIFYGILLAAISLPFLFQLFEQLLSIFSW